MSTRPDERLSRLLHERADGQRPAPIPFGEVVGRARVVRRRRRTAAAALAAAVVAVIAVPTALVLGGEPDAAPPPSHQVTPSPTPSPSPSKNALPGLALSRVQLGTAPSIPYVTGHTIHLGSTTVTIPSTIRTPAAVAAYHGGWLVQDQRGPGAQFDNQGRTLRRGIGELKTSADGVQIAFGARNGKVLVGTEMAEGVQSFGIAKPGHVVGFLSGGRLIYDDNAGQPGSVLMMGNGPQPPLGALFGATDANESTDLVAGMTDQTEFAVVSAASGKILWRSKQWVPLSFSPNGRYVSATPPRDGGDVERLAILDARSGRLVTTLRLGSRGLSLQANPVWESDTSMVFGVEEQRAPVQAILRLSADGSVDRATAVRRSPTPYAPYAFAARP